MNLGRVVGLWRYPVKSMAGGRLDAAVVTPRGVVGDRAWALLDRASGKPLSAKRHAKLLLCRARYLDEPTEETVPPAEVELPDGTTVRTDDPAAAAALSRHLGVDCAPVLSPGRHFDARPLHLASMAALRSLRDRSGLDCDPRRFRPNVLVETASGAPEEQAWVGRRLRAGELELDVVKPVKRCVMTDLPQPGLAEARGTLAAVVESGGTLGVYAAPARGGLLRAGDALSWTDGAEMA